MMKRIAIFDTALGTSNLGDEIIFEEVRRNMGSIFDSHFSLRLATHVNNFSVWQMLRRNSKIRFFQEADWKFICGTNLIAQTRIGKINSQWQLTPSNLSIYKNCVLIGAGTTEDKETLDPYARFLYRSVLSKKFIHSVRDELTRGIVESLGCRAVNTGCPTLWDLTPERCSGIPAGKGDSCVVSVSGYGNQTDEERDSMMLGIVTGSYGNVRAWIQTTEDDGYLTRLEKRLGIPPLYRIYSLSAFREVLLSGRTDYVGTRLHGGIFAMRNGCRSLIISIDHRADGLRETNNIPALSRKDIGSQLERLINSSFTTDIHLNVDAIAKFKSQFSGDINTI